MTSHLLIDSFAHSAMVPGMAKKPAGKKLLVTERALVQRINRKLRYKYEGVQRGRNLLPEPSWCLMDFNRNSLLEEHVDLETLGRELGCLAAWEQVEDPS